ncbi:hypothetical protein [Paenibacillus amylolyticus]|uniref:hypothetical protein n=1 Tax=Paenibacillus amylolyticus TaxID=1451 RepID=UPI0039AED626
MVTDGEEKELCIGLCGTGDDGVLAKKLTDAGQTIDDKNIIIQGTDPETKDVWSLIGGTLAGQEGVIELTLTWTES